MATERKNRAATFLDAATADLGGRKVASFLDRCQALIPWNELAGSVSDVFVDDGGSRRDGPGRPRWRPASPSEGDGFKITRREPAWIDRHVPRF